MSTQLWSTLAGAGLGLMLGIGLLVVLRALPWTRRADVAGRIEPYVRRRRSGSGLLEREQGAGGRARLLPLVHPVAGRLVALVERIGDGRGQLERRLRLAGEPTALEGYRVEQVVWGIAGLVAGIALATVLSTARGLPLVGGLVLVVLGGVGGVLGRDWWLGQQVQARARTMMREFPTVADLLALAVSAGEGPLAALERVASTCHGELPREFRRTVNEIRAGTSLVPALADLGARTPLPAMERFVDGITIAIERGTPLAEVLRAQAQDARELARRDLMEIAGRREISMLVPIVFFIMPLVIVFAIYPGLSVLDLAIR